MATPCFLQGGGRWPPLVPFREEVGDNSLLPSGRRQVVTLVLSREEVGDHPLLSSGRRDIVTSYSL